MHSLMSRGCTGKTFGSWSITSCVSSSNVNFPPRLQHVHNASFDPKFSGLVNRGPCAHTARRQCRKLEFAQFALECVVESEYVGVIDVSVRFFLPLASAHSHQDWERRAAGASTEFVA